ncbi:MAG: HEAT repeat domain-containing protein [bacterium]|nr:hypothetical protein [Planctomycetota bacterium]HIL50712.1 hypothetical protein [Planctomycetota bacterium]
MTGRTTPGFVRFAAALLLIVAFALASGAQTPRVNREQMWPAPSAEDWARPCLISWQRTWQDAVEVSRRTQRPLMIAVNMDGEIASEHWAGIRYREADTARLYEPFVCVIASVYRHNARDYNSRGERILCPRFGSVTCGEHISIEPELYQTYFEGKRIAPRHIGVELDKREIMDVYYALDIQSVKLAIHAGAADRPYTPRVDTSGDRSLVQLVASPDMAHRRIVEQAYSKGDFAVRQELLQAAARIHDIDHIDLLRRALFGDDAELSAIAFAVLCQTNSESAVDLLAAVLRLPMSAEDRQPLLEALERLSATWPRAGDIATVHRGLAQPSTALAEQVGAGEPVGSASYATHVALESRLERTADQAHREPLDADHQLDIAGAFLALAVRPEASARHARVLFDDALRAARKAEELGATGWRVDSILGLVNHYMGQRGKAQRRIERALTVLPAGADDWNSMAVLELFAQSREARIRRAAERRRQWPAEWLSDLQAAFETLACHPFGTDGQVAAHHDFLLELGAGAQAAIALDRGLARFKDSWLLHDRLRGRALESALDGSLEAGLGGGSGGLEAIYAAMLAEPDASPNLPWFAGYASFVAAEYLRRAGAAAEAGEAYERAMAHFERAATQVPKNRSSSDHYIALAIAAQARMALEEGQYHEAHGLLLESFGRSPGAAGHLDGLNLTPVMSAKALLERLAKEGHEDLVASLQEALENLPEEAREAPEFERNARGQEPSRDARRFGGGR